MKIGKVYGVGLGPGNPELITIKSVNILKSAEYIFFFKKKSNDSRALSIVKDIINKDSVQIALEYPVTTEIDSKDSEYKLKIKNFYEESVIKMNNILKKPSNICLLCEGDPFFYGSFIHIFKRLKEFFEIEIVPGVTGMSGAWSATKIPMVSGQEVMTVLMGTLSEEKLKFHVKKSDGIVIILAGNGSLQIIISLLDILSEITLFSIFALAAIIILSSLTIIFSPFFTVLT